MTAHAAVGVDDDLSSGETAVTLGTADDEEAGGVDVILGFLGEKFAGDDGFDQLFLEDLADLGGADAGGVLGRDDHRGDAGGLAIDVFHGDLGLRVGTEPGVLAALAEFGDGAAELVRIEDRRGHERGGLVHGVAEHDPLVAGTLLGGFLAIGGSGVDALGDVRGLLAEGVDEEEVRGVELTIVVGVTDLGDGGLDHFTVVELRRGRDLTAEDDDVILHESLASDAGLGILLETRVHDGVGDGVAHFIGVTFGDGLG